MSLNVIPRAFGTCLVDISNACSRKGWIKSKIKKLMIPPTSLMPLPPWINPAQYRWMENGIVSKVSLRIAMLNLPRIQKITNFLSKSPFESGRKYLRSTRTENNFQSISCRNWIKSVQNMMPWYSLWLRWLHLLYSLVSFLRLLRCRVHVRRGGW